MNNMLRQQCLDNKSIYISCVVPIFNEEALLESFVPQLSHLLSSLTHQYEIIFIDDGSLDNSLQKITQLSTQYPLKLLSLSRNFGKEIALTAGIEHAKGEVVIILDADFQHPLDTIPTFLNYWAKGYDMVYGTRQDRENESVIKRSFTRIFYWLMKKMTSIDLPHNAGDFRLMDKKVVAALNQFPERSRFMKGLYAWVGFKKIGVPFVVQDRVVGKSRFGFAKLAELAVTGITSFSTIPLRIWGVIGLIISLIALIYAIYIVTVTLLFGADLPGFPTLIVAIMFLGGVQLLSIGILGEYMARIFIEVKQRPTYLLQKKEGFDE
jgi:glycosyltransferase involved in cell wall biosynthesis